MCGELNDRFIKHVKACKREYTGADKRPEITIA